MVNGKFDFGADFDDNSFKSCFARSVAVNSQYRQPKTTVSDVRQQQLHHQHQPADTSSNKKNNRGSPETVDQTNGSHPFVVEASPPYVARLRKESHSHVEDNRRFSCHSATNSRRGSLCSNRPLPNIPIENIVFQTQIDTLQWQLKQAEASREMYRAVMKQVVSFLERAHRSLELLGTRLNAGHHHQPVVYRSRSEHHMTAVLNATDQSVDSNDYADCTWRRPKKHQSLPPEEIPPEKLSQEAFRLLRTAQSLLNTREPDLAHINNEAQEDLEFISQLAKEFPQENKPQRITSFSLSPKLLTPDRETRISATLNRKLSLRLNETGPSSYRESPSSYGRSDPFTSLDNNFLLSSTIMDDKMPPSAANGDGKSGEKDCGKFKFEPEKSSSPPVSSVGSAEDESGFSSMNSFQEVGLPLVNSTVNEETLTREALLKSMLHTDCTSNYNSMQTATQNGSRCKMEDYKLWQKPDVTHRRSSSTPVETEKITMKVLWV